MANLRDKIKEAPTVSGIYHFLDNAGDILYIGKAKNLRNRLRQYFLKELGRGPAIDQMVALAVDVRWIETGSEIEAVILEAEYIRQFKPKYNIRLRDDKSFLAVKITKEDFPCVSLVRYRDINLSDKKNWYFGPYPAGELLKKSLRYLRKIFPHRDCTVNKYNSYSKKMRCCIFSDIKVCPGPCNLLINKEEYQKNISYLRDFLRGQRPKVVKGLKKEMAKLSKEKEYEKAAIVRDKLKALDHLNEVALGIQDDLFISGHIFKRIECYDISNIQGEHAVGSMVVFTEGRADKDEYRRFKIKDSEIGPKEGSSDLSRLKEMLERRFNNNWPQPDLLVIDGGELHLKVAETALASCGLKVPVVSISKGAARKKNDFHFSGSEAAEYFNKNSSLQKIAINARDEAHRFAISYYRKLHRKALLTN